MSYSAPGATPSTPVLSFFNDWTYPNFIALLDELGVASKATSMGFSVSDPVSGLEYSGASLDTLFAQRRNLLSPGFVGMVRDILRFNREAVADLEAGRLAPGETLGAYLARNGYGERFSRPLPGAHGFGDLVGELHERGRLPGGVLPAVFLRITDCFR